jgi:hypothetical protein
MKQLLFIKKWTRCAMAIIFMYMFGMGCNDGGCKKTNLLTGPDPDCKIDAYHEACCGLPCEISIGDKSNLAPKDGVLTYSLINYDHYFTPSAIHFYADTKDSMPPPPFTNFMNFNLEVKQGAQIWLSACFEEAGKDHLVYAKYTLYDESSGQLIKDGIDSGVCH